MMLLNWQLNIQIKTKSIKTKKQKYEGKKRLG